MKAMVYTKYGTPDVLKMTEVPRPILGDNDILIKIHATSVTTAGLASLSGKPFIARIASPDLGLMRPKQGILGVELAGEVVEIGSTVDRFEIGDAVFAEPERGTFAEYIAMPQDGLVTHKAPSASYEEAAAACDGFLTAMPFLRDGGKLQAGQHVLVNGASASIGTMAVQIAKHMGAEITGVCSTANLELVRSLGADHVIDYTQEDFTRSDQIYDIIFDVVAKSSFSRCKRVLADDGVYLCTFPKLGALLPKLGWRKAKFIATGLRPTPDRLKDLRLLKQMMETGAVRTVIDRRYPLEQTAEAHRYVAGGHKKGNVVITVCVEDS